MTDVQSIENARDLDILEQIENNPDSTQASLAAQLGVAVGTVNWHVKRLVEKGYVKIQRCERRKLKYIITPEGLALRARLTFDYIHSSMELYRLIRKRMDAVIDECQKREIHNIRISGNEELAEVCRLTCLDRGMTTEDADGLRSANVKIIGLKLFAEYPGDNDGLCTVNSEGE